MTHVSSSIIREGPLVSDEQQRLLSAPFTRVDVKEVLFDIEENKASALTDTLVGSLRKHGSTLVMMWLMQC